MLTNYDAVKAGREDPQLELDGFYICDGVIDQCFFLSESLLFIIVNKKEVRILYSQNFTPGVFEPEYISEDLRTRKKGADGTSDHDLASKEGFTKLKEKYVGQVSSYAEKDKGYRLLIDDEIRFKDNTQGIDDGELRSKFNFNPMVCSNNDYVVIALGKTTIGQRNLIHWEEYLDLIRRTNPDDWLKVLRAALDIYNGKMVGLAGLPD